MFLLSENIDGLERLLCTLHDLHEGTPEEPLLGHLWRTISNTMGEEHEQRRNLISISLSYFNFISISCFFARILFPSRARLSVLLSMIHIQMDNWMEQYETPQQLYFI